MDNRVCERHLDICNHTVSAVNTCLKRRPLLSPCPISCVHYAAQFILARITMRLSHWTFLETVYCRAPTHHSTQQGAMALPPQGPTVSRTTPTQTCASQSEPRKRHLGETVATHIDCFYMTVANNLIGGIICCGSLFQSHQPLIGITGVPQASSSCRGG